MGGSIFSYFLSFVYSWRCDDMDMRSGEHVCSMLIFLYLLLFVSFVGFLDIVYCQLNIMNEMEVSLLAIYFIARKPEGE